MAIANFTPEIWQYLADSAHQTIYLDELFQGIATLRGEAYESKEPQLAHARVVKMLCAENGYFPTPEAIKETERLALDSAQELGLEEKRRRRAIKRGKVVPIPSS